MPDDKAPPDRIQREIEDILNRLDAFVPDETAARRARRRPARSPSHGRSLLSPIAGISLRQVTLTALILIFAGFVGMRVDPLVGRWVLIGGVILLLTSFALSFAGGRGGPPAPEKHWRGRPIDLHEPTFRERLRAWLQPKRRPRP